MQNPDIYNSENSDEIDLLDLLIVIAQNIKLLVFGPILIGITAFLGAYMLPQSFESESFLSTSKPGINASSQVLARYIKSADILEKVAEEAGVGRDLGASAVQRKMQKLVSVNVGKQDQLVSLTTRGVSPEEAQALNYLMWKHVLPLTIPRGSEKQGLQEQLASEEQSLESAKELEASTALRLTQGGASESMARLYGELLAANSQRKQRIETLKSQLEGLTMDNLAQRPTLSEIAVAPKKPLIAVASALGTGMILLIFIFVRHGLTSSSNNPEQAKKLAQLRAAFRR